MKAGACINATGGQYGSALQAATVGGYKEIVEILITAGADVKGQGGEYGNALQAAALRGNMKILMKVGADVNAQGGKYGNALQAAPKKWTQRDCGNPHKSGRRCERSR